MSEKTKLKEDLFRNVFDAVPDGAIIADASFRVIDMNQAAQSIFGVARSKAIGKRISDIFSSSIEKVAKKALFDERTVFGDETMLVLRTGDRIPVQSLAFPLFSGEGSILGVAVQVRDLSGIKFLSERAVQHGEASALEELILGFAHEIKNPLSGIRGAAQILLEEKKDETCTKCSEIIIKEVDRLSSLLKNLRQLEPLSTEVFEHINIHEVLSEVVFLESKSEKGKKINFVESFDVTLPPILGDRDSLKQVFFNLIKNAIEATKRGGTVEVSTRWIADYKLKGEDAISVEIRDEGVGISPENIEKIFAPFYTTKAGGTGLGLFIIRQIIAKHGGAVFVESERGRGSTFNVYLPVLKC